MAGTAGQDNTQASPEIILNLTARQRRPMLILLIPAVLVPVFLGWNIYTYMAVGFAFIGLYRAWTIKVVLSGDTMSSQDLFFRRKFKRKQILKLGEEKVGAVRRTYVTTDKRLYYLPAPIDGRLARNPNFDAHYAIVDDWWRGRRPRVTRPAPE